MSVEHGALKPELTAIRDFLEANDISATLVDNSLLVIGVTGDNSSWMCYIQFFSETVLSVYSVFLPDITDEKYHDLIELLNHINLHVNVGHYEFNHKGREIRFKTSIDCSKIDDISEVLTSLLFHNWANFDFYRPFIDLVLKGDKSPKEAVEMACEIMTLAMQD